jgi:LysR family transcriptional regulator for metE and metH
MKRIELPPPSSRLDSRDLRLVLALANSRTTAAAAGTLHITQSAVSRALLAAEERLGVRLFDRTPRGLEPTPACATLIANAPRVLEGIAELEAQLCGRRTTPQPLRLVCECYTAYHWMPSALQRLRSSLPGVDLSIALASTHDPIGSLRDGTIDAALISEAPLPRSRRLSHKALFSDEVVFVMAASHRLASRPALLRVDLEGEALFTSRLPTPDMHWFNRPLASRHAPALQYQALPLTEAVVDFARAGLGIGILSEWVAEPHLRRGDVVARRMASGPLLRPWHLVWRNEVAGPAAALWQALENAAPRGSTLPAASAPRARRRA